MALTTFAEDRRNVTRWEMHHAWARDARTIMQSYDDDTLILSDSFGNIYISASSPRVKSCRGVLEGCSIFLELTCIILPLIHLPGLAAPIS